MNINLTPKGRFLETPTNLGPHRKMVDSPEFIRATEIAMLQFQLAITQSGVDQKEMSLGPAGLKVLGAQEFLSILKNLSETPKAPPTILRADNLNHAI